MVATEKLKADWDAQYGASDSRSCDVDTRDHRRKLRSCRSNAAFKSAEHWYCCKEDLLVLEKRRLGKTKLMELSRHISIQAKRQPPNAFSSTPAV
jgi:hypothetical protein